MLTNTLFAERYKLLQCTQQNDSFEWWKAEDVKTRNVVTIKFNKQNGLATSSAALLKEYLLLTQVTHPRLLMPLHYDDYNQQSYIVFLYADGYSLKDTILNEKKLNETEAKNLLRALTEGLQALHQQNIAHRNIQPANVFIIHHQYQLGPFRRQQDMAANAQEEVLPYAAPELFGTQPEYNYKCDVFSLGVLIYQACTHHLPWQGLGGIALQKGGMVPNLPVDFSETFNKLIASCMAFDATQRPNAEVILATLNEITIAKPIVSQLVSEAVPVIKEPISIQQVKLNNETEVVTETTVDENKSNRRLLVALMLFFIITAACFYAYKSFNAVDTENEVALTQDSTVTKEYTNTKVEESQVENNKPILTDTKDEVLAEIPDTTSTVKKKWRKKLKGITSYRSETGKYGFMDKNYNIITKAIYDDVFNFEEGLAAVKQNGLWGFIDAKGKFVVKPLYNHATNFKEGVASVEKNNLVMKIDKSGNCIEGCATANTTIE